MWSHNTNTPIRLHGVERDKFALHTSVNFVSDQASFTLNSYSCIAHIQGGSNMTGTDLRVNKPHCATAVRP